MNKRLTADLVQFALHRLVPDGSWSSWGLDPDFVRVDVPTDSIGPNEIEATISMSFKTSDSNGGWTTVWAIRVPCLSNDRLGPLRVWPKDTPDPVAAAETVYFIDLANHMMEYEIESQNALAGD